MVKRMDIVNMPVCKLDFDEEVEEQEYQNYTKEFRTQLAMEVDSSSNNSFSNYRRNRQSTNNGRIFSPRKPIRSMQLTNNNNCGMEVTTSPFSTTFTADSSTKPVSFKGYHISPTNSISPPDKKVRALRLFDSPNTPKTLLQKSQDTPVRNNSSSQRNFSSRPSTRSCLFGVGSANSSRLRSSVFSSGNTTITNNNIHTIAEVVESSTDIGGNNKYSSVDTISSSSSSGVTGSSTSSCNSTCSFGSSLTAGGKEEAKNMRANINPFTPTNILLSSKKRSRKAKKLNTSKNNESLLNSSRGNNTTATNNNSSYSEAMDQDDCSSTTATNPALAPPPGGLPPLLAAGDDPHHNNHHHSNNNNNNTTTTPPTSSDDDLSDDDEDANTSEDDSDDDLLGNPSKRIAIHEVNVSRYNKEFAEISVIGKGVFGSVYLCRHRLDGCLYAIKRSLKPVAGSSTERTALNEVYAHAVLGAHQHVVRYYSAWAEDDHMIIQNEYCNGGSLAQAIQENRAKETSYTEEQSKVILLHLAKGLKFIHSLHMVHLDVKPDNIFMSCEQFKHNTPNASNHQKASGHVSADDGFEEDDHSAAAGRKGAANEHHNTEFIYKIGDLGHVTSVMNPKVEEGDCRYLPREILQEEYGALQKVDIFALGLTLYEASSGSSLPLNGAEWQEIRNGALPDIAGYSKAYQDLLKLMIHHDPNMRPTAAQLVNNDVFHVSSRGGSSGCSNKSRVQLKRELEIANQRNQVLEKQLQQAKFFLAHLSPGAPLNLSPSSIVGINNNNYATGPADNATTIGLSDFSSEHVTTGVMNTTSTPGTQLFNFQKQFAVPNSGSNGSIVPSTSLLSGNLFVNGNTNSYITGDDCNPFSITCGSGDYSPVNNNNITRAQSPGDRTISPTMTNNMSRPHRQYHYNTRSAQQQQRANQQNKQQQQVSKLKLYSSRAVGRKTARSQSVL